jgi:hypothetical protein
MARLPDFTPLGLRPGFPQFVLEDTVEVRGTSLARVRCPRCDEAMFVNLDKWAASRGVNTRSCTYCFKVSALPKEVAS